MIFLPSFAGTTRKPGVDAFTSALLHMNGTDGSTVFKDETGKTWTANGNAQIDTAQSVFGGASGLFDGSGDYITTPDHVDFALGTEPFTIDFWVRYNALPASGAGMSIFCQNVDSSNNYRMYLFNNAGTYQYVFQCNSTSLIISIIKNASAAATGTWYHIALVRSGNSWYMFQDGSQIGTTDTDADAIPNLAGLFYIGTYPAGGIGDLNGWIDEFRISKGIARWTSNFTPPTSPY